MYTFYFAAESPACRSYDRWTLPVAPPAVAYCCRYGVELAAAVLPVETYTQCHDGLRDMVEVVMREASIDVVSEPAHIFDALIQPHILMRQGATPAIIPDLMASVSMPAVATARGQRVGQFLPARRLLFDVKTTHAGHGMYLTPRARDEQLGAVGERARHGRGRG